MLIIAERLCYFRQSNAQSTLFQLPNKMNLSSIFALSRECSGASCEHKLRYSRPSPTTRQCRLFVKAPCIPRKNLNFVSLTILRKETNCALSCTLVLKHINVCNPLTVSSLLFITVEFPIPTHIPSFIDLRREFILLQSSTTSLADPRYFCAFFNISAVGICRHSRQASMINVLCLFRIILFTLNAFNKIIMEIHN